MQIEVAGRTITYFEVSGNGLTRGIRLFQKGVQNSDIVYWFNPNPHENRAYNKNQPLFYRTAAELIGLDINDGAWPPHGTVIHVMGEDYELQA